MYVAEFDANVEVQPVMPLARQAVIEQTTDPLLKRQRYCVWRLLCDALQQVTGKCADELSFTVDGNGKWRCDGCVHFSLSHSGNVVAVAVARQPVGIDVEALDDKRFNARLARRILTENELTLYNSVPPCERPQALVKTWTQKESLFKRDGGSIFAPKQIDTTLHQTQCQTYKRYLVAVAL